MPARWPTPGAADPDPTWSTTPFTPARADPPRCPSRTLHGSLDGPSPSEYDATVSTPNHGALLRRWAHLDFAARALIADPKAPGHDATALLRSYLETFVAWRDGAPRTGATPRELAAQAAHRDPALRRTWALAERVLESRSGAAGRVEALLELRALLDFRAGALIEAAWPIEELEAPLRGLVVHGLPAERFASVLAGGALLSRDQQALDSRDDTTPGRCAMLDPHLFRELVFFGPCHPRYLGAERAANAHRTGNPDLVADYRPSVRLVFEKSALGALPDHVDLGLPRLTVRGRVPIHLTRFVLAADPGDHVRVARLLAEHAPTLLLRLLAVPWGPECTAPEYVVACNRAMVDAMSPQDAGGE